jgi:serine/threonine protein kinase
MATLSKPAIGSYRVIDLVGAGGVGEVYRAVDPRTGRVVAIKTLNRARAGESLPRFLDEARLQAKLSHPGIVRFYEFLEHEEQPCIVMEYVDGETLGARIRRRGALPVREVLKLFDSITSAVSYLHARRIVHRDLKSDNIRISSSGAVKLLDFGLSRRAGSPPLTLAGYVAGTFEYLSPELLEGVEATPASDIWALGVLLYEALSGRLPFEAANIGDLCRRICSATIIPLGSVNPVVPVALERVVRRCLERRPSNRFASVDGLRGALLPVANKPAEPRHGRWAWPSDLWRLVRAGSLRWRAAALAVSLAAGLAFVHNRPPRSPEPDAAWKTVSIDSVGGRASVYREGKLVGSTPVQIRGRPGERVVLTLKRPGSRDLMVDFTVTERSSYTYTMDAAGM